MKYLLWILIMLGIFLMIFGSASCEEFTMPSKQIQEYITIAHKWFPLASEKEITIILFMESRYKNIQHKEPCGYSYGLGSVTRSAAWDVCANYRIIPHRLMNRQFNVLMVAGYLTLLKNKYGLSADKSIIGYNMGIMKAKKYKITKYLKNYRHWSKQYDKLADKKD